MITIGDTATSVKEAAGAASRPAARHDVARGDRGSDSRPVISAADACRRSRRSARAGRNYTLLTAAAVVTNLGSQGALIAAALAVLETGGDGG